MKLQRKHISIATALLLGACSTSVSNSENRQKLNVLTDSFNEVTVQPPTCPDWTGGRFSVRNFDTQDSHSNYACATVNNYGQMIADPLDMVVGKSSDHYDGQTAGNAVAATRSVEAE